jgi:hypothetical protein
MARDSKLNITFTRDTAALVGNGALRIENLAGAASTTDRNVFVFANAAGGANDLLRASSNVLNIGGFRNTLADASVLVSQAGGSAISGDPAILGNTSFAEMYCRVTLAAAGVAAAANTRGFLVVEAASDSGTGTAGSDWQAVSPQIDVRTAGTTLSAATAGQVRTVPTGSTSSGVVTSTAHGLAVGDIVVFTANTSGAVTLNKPYYVNTVTDANTFSVSASVNGATDTAVTGSSAFTATATPLQKRLIGIAIAPNARPWIRLSVIMTGTGQVAQSQGVWVQDATFSVGRDSAATL